MSSRCFFLVPAAGYGARMKADTPKQFLTVNGRSILEYTLESLRGAGVFSGGVVVMRNSEKMDFSGGDLCPIWTAEGGAEREDSVLSGLTALAEHASLDDWVLVHDAARPCISAEDICSLVARVQEESAVGGILAKPVRDTLKKSNGLGGIEATVDRSTMWQALTPQMFRLEELKDAIESAKRASIVLTDEASAMEAQGYQPLLVEGRGDNIKVTFPEDLDIVEAILSKRKQG